MLSDVLAGASAERRLTGWARGARYAGSKDRAAVRDHVFDALRRLRSAGWAAGLGDRPLDRWDARAVIAGCLHLDGGSPEALFDGSRHGPAPWASPPAVPPLREAPDGVRLDLPDWLLPHLRATWGAAADRIADALRDRAPAILRANAARTTREALARRLAADGFDAVPHPLSPTALTLPPGTRGLTAHPAFAEGMFEMQDAGSQAMVDRLPLGPGMAVLDLCAGGGGKTLAMAGRCPGLRLFAHDADADRLAPLGARAARAGVSVDLVADPGRAGPYDLVVADVPCSGSGAWRRAPEAKWRLTPERLNELRDVQREILDRALRLAAPGGTVAYMTCSLFAAENAEQTAWFAECCGAGPGLVWACTPLDGADGFYLATFRRT